MHMYICICILYVYVHKPTLYIVLRGRGGGASNAATQPAPSYVLLSVPFLCDSLRKKGSPPTPRLHPPPRGILPQHKTNPTHAVQAEGFGDSPFTSPLS